MKWTYDWLKDYLKTDKTPEEIADILTRTGLEVEDIISPVVPIAAKIVECNPLPDSDHLHILMVNDGTDKLRQVVCGAPNVRVGLVSALALPGCVISGHEIKSGKLRGVLSDGMMCSESELGIGDDNSGIMELPNDTKIGTPVISSEIVFDAGITPNRPDYLAVRGIARDLAASGAGVYIEPKDDVIKPVKSVRGVHIKTDKCQVYQFCEIHDIKMGPSTDRIKSRLSAIGINPKDAAIDATNYICYDMAQPMHCFDADEINGDIIIRNAKDKEKFTDLFGKEHELQETDVVISDKTGVLALAGVIGGARGMTTEKTKNIILESAYFDSVSVRKTSKRIGISTDASYRYERGIDPTITGIALKNATDIIMKQCGGKIIGTGIDGTIPSQNVHIKYSPDLFLKKTGINMDEKTQQKILENLGYTLEINAHSWIITPRPARVDIVIPESIISELVRVYGYDKIAANATHKPSDSAPHNDNFITIKRELAARSLNENKSFGFGNSKIEELLSDKPSVIIANPIVIQMDTARNGLLGNMLQCVAENEKRGYYDLNLFELGTVFNGDTPGQQFVEICIVRTGNTAPRHWSHRNRTVDVYDVKADIVALMHGQKFTISIDNPPRWAHPFRFGRIMQGKKTIAEFGELHPVVAKKLHIKTNVEIAIVPDVSVLPTARKLNHASLSEFQPITRDFAFIVNSDTPAATLVSATMEADSRITNVVVFDTFDMGDNQKSIALTITIQPNTNMSDEDLLSLQNIVIANVEKKCNAIIRDK